MTQITFENAAFSEIIKRADRVAPKKGEAFDKASGIVISIDPSNEWGVTVSATNLDVYYREWVTHLGIEGDATVWRIPSLLFAALITKLPIGSGKSVTLRADGGMLHIQSGRFKAKLGLLDPSYYPKWDQFDTSATSPVANLGARIEQVGWATDKGAVGSALNGIRFDGKTLAATDRFRLVTVPCEVPQIVEPVVVPAAILGPLIKQMGDTNVGIVDGRLAFVPNEYTQISTVIFGDKYPNVERVMQRDHDGSVTFNKTQLIEAIARVVTADQKSRMPELRMFIGAEEIAVYMEDNGGRDSVGDVVEVSGQATHARAEYFVTPSTLVEALTAAPSERVTLNYSPSNRMKMWRIDGGSGYEAWIMLRTGARQQPEGES